MTRKNNDQLSSLYRQAYRAPAFGEAENCREISQVLRHFHYAHNRHNRGYSREQKEYLLKHFSLLAPGDVAGLLQIDAHAALDRVLNRAVDGDFSQTAQLPAIFTQLSDDTLAYTNTPSR